MKRPSEYVAGLVDTLDSLAGRCFSKHDDMDFIDKVCQYRPSYILADVALHNSEVFLDGAAKGLDYLFAKPLRYLENLLFGKQE